MAYHVSKLLNFFVTTFPRSIPSLSTILWARSGCEVPLNTFIFGILLLMCALGFSKFARNKLLARTDSDKTGITVKRMRITNSLSRWCQFRFRQTLEFTNNNKFSEYWILTQNKKLLVWINSHYKIEIKYYVLNHKSINIFYKMIRHV